jgi:O-antigen/teichoic acid export membrane protein
VVKGSLVNVLGRFGRLSKSLYYLVLTRFVGAEVLGLYTLGWSLVDLFSKFGLFGLDRGVIRFVSQRHSDGDAEGAHRVVGQALALGLTASLLATAGVWVAAPWLAASVFHQPALSPVLRILALAIPFLVVSLILLSALRAVRIMKFDVYVRSIAEPFVLLAAAVALCALGWTVPGLAFAYLIAAAGGLAFSARFFSRIFSPSRCLSGVAGSPLRSPIAAFSTPVLFDDALYVLMSRLGLFVLAMFLPAASVGVYAATTGVAEVVKNIRQAVDPIFSPVASGLVHKREKGRLAALFSSVTRWVLVLDLAFLMGVGLWGGAILSAFGPAFAAGFWCLVFLTFGHVASGVLGSAETLLLASGRSGLNLLNSVFFVIVSVGLHLLLIPRYGVSGAALATALSQTLVNVLRVAEVGVLLGIHPFRRSLLKPVAAVALAFVAGLFLMQLGSPWSYLSALSLPLYFGLLWAFGAEAEDREVLERLRHRVPFLSRPPQFRAAS